MSRVEEALAEAWEIHRFEATTRVGQPENPDSKNVQPRGAALAAADEAKGGYAVGPAEFLQWLGDMSSMLVHEQWRKEVSCRLDLLMAEPGTNTVDQTMKYHSGRAVSGTIKRRHTSFTCISRNSGTKSTPHTKVRATYTSVPLHNNHLYRTGGAIVMKPSPSLPHLQILLLPFHAPLGTFVDGGLLPRGVIGAITSTYSSPVVFEIGGEFSGSNVDGQDLRSRTGRAARRRSIMTGLGAL